MLKTLSFGISLVAAVASSATAQEVLATLSGGRTSAYHTYPPEASRRYARIGWAAALGVRLHVRGVLSSQLEAALVNRGDGDRLVGVHARYLELPVLLRIESPHPILGVVPAGLVGLAPAVLVRCRAWSGAATVQELSPPSTPTLYPTDCVIYFTDVYDVGLVVAVALERTLLGVRLGIELRKTHGLSDIASGYSCCTVKNRTTSLLATAALPLGRLW